MINDCNKFYETIIFKWNQKTEHTEHLYMQQINKIHTEYEMTIERSLKFICNFCKTRTNYNNQKNEKRNL